MEKEQRLRFSIYRLQYCWSVCVCVCVYFKKPTSHEYAFTCIIEKTAYLLSWAQRLNAGASGCGQPACSQFWCPCTPEGLSGPFLQQALPRCRRNGQIRENALTPQRGEQVWMNTPENPTVQWASWTGWWQGRPWGCRRRWRPQPRPRLDIQWQETSAPSTWSPTLQACHLITLPQTHEAASLSPSLWSQTTLLWPQTGNSQHLHTPAQGHPP